MDTNLPLSLIQLVLAVACAAMAWSSLFAVTTGLRYHAVSTRRRDLRLATANLFTFIGMSVALLVDDLVFGLVAASPFMAFMATLVFRFDSPQAEARIARSARTSRAAS